MEKDKVRIEGTEDGYPWYCDDCLIKTINTTENEDFLNYPPNSSVSFYYYHSKEDRMADPVVLEGPEHEEQ